MFIDSFNSSFYHCLEVTCSYIVRLLPLSLTFSFVIFTLFHIVRFIFKKFYKGGPEDD